MLLSSFEQKMLEQCKKTGDELFVGTKNHRLHLVPINKTPTIALNKIELRLERIETFLFGNVVARRIAK